MIARQLLDGTFNGADLLVLVFVSGMAVVAGFAHRRARDVRGVNALRELTDRPASAWRWPERPEDLRVVDCVSREFGGVTRGPQARGSHGA